MYSLNVPVPPAVARLASDVADRLPGAAPRSRGEHTLVLKRLGEADYDRLEARAREALAGEPAVAARVAGVGVFEEPAAGAAPVVYLAVESPGLEALHRRLAATFEPADGVEGPDYVPHVTAARGGSLDAARDLELPGDPVEWTVDELVLWDATYAQPVSRVSL